VVSFDSKYSLDAGHVFEGKYQILRELGTGGFGVVYLAQQLSMDRPVALKILKPGVGAHAPSARERFLREVKIISRLHHPNTVTIHDYGETIHGVVYMVLEFVEGETLKKVLHREGAQDPFRTLSVARQVARSLAEAHKHGIVHRDLKPANIMLSRIDADSDFVKVLDFGVARLRDSEEADLTSAGVPEGERALIGTPRYMSPEQVRGEDLTGASDVYGLGLIMYEMLIGEPAVQGDTTMGLITQQLSSEPLRLPSLHALSPPIQALIRRTTEKSLQRRFQTANDLARGIDETVMQLGDAVATDQRAAYFAVSGRFPVMAKPGSQNPTGPATPSGVTHHTFPGEPSQQHHHVGVPVTAAAAASADGSMDWYETQFEPNQLHQGAAVAAPAAAVAALPLITNQIDYDSDDPLMSVLDDELPPPPDESVSPFAEPEPDPELEEEEFEEDDESLAAFSFGILKVCALASLAVFLIITTFLIIGALVGEFVDGAMRMAIAASIALAIPLFTSLGEFTQRERFEVVQRVTDRVARVLFGISIFSAAAVFLASFSMPGLINAHLRNDPNWMFQPAAGVVYEPTPTTNLNQKYSFFLADMIEKATAAVGRYDGEPTKAQEPTDLVEQPVVLPPPPPEPTRPGTRSTAPPPTRPGTRTAQQPDESDEIPDEPTAETEEAPEQATPPPAPRRQSPPPTRPRPQPSEDEDSDYVRW
jgi:eukaryotic-like serine/threonine-protein kinase